MWSGFLVGDLSCPVWLEWVQGFVVHKHHNALGNIRVPYNGYLFGITKCLSIASVRERQNQFRAEFAGVENIQKYWHPWGHHVSAAMMCWCSAAPETAVKNGQQNGHCLEQKQCWPWVSPSYSKSLVGIFGNTCSKNGQDHFEIWSFLCKLWTLGTISHWSVCFISFHSFILSLLRFLSPILMMFLFFFAGAL